LSKKRQTVKKEGKSEPVIKNRKTFTVSIHFPVP